MEDLAIIRAGLERLLAETAERHHQLDIREQELAAAMELLTIDPAVRAAYNHGEADAYRRVQRLIQMQLDALPRCSGARTVLRKLSELVG